MNQVQVFVSYVICRLSSENESTDTDAIVIARTDKLMTAVEPSRMTRKSRKTSNISMIINFPECVWLMDTHRICLKNLNFQLTQCITGRSSMQTPIRGFSILTWLTLSKLMALSCLIYAPRSIVALGSHPLTECLINRINFRAALSIAGRR